jgi:hypothetical protein
VGAVGAVAGSGLDPSHSYSGVTMDIRSFCRTVNEEGREYQYRAMELIKVCNVFSETSGQSLHQVVRLQR